MGTQSLKIIIAAAAVALAPACASPPVNRDASVPLTTVATVDLERYLGRWYEIARSPNAFEDGCEGVTADYGRRADGLLSVVNSCRRGDASGPLKVARGRARVADAATNAKLEVSFFGPFWRDYWIIGLAEDYSLALIGEPSGRYLWILARAPVIDSKTREGALARLETLGYEVSKLYFPSQPPSPDNPRP